MRTSSAHGLHLQKIATVKSKTVEETLRALEERYPTVGASLLDIFFPGSLRVKDDKVLKFWNDVLKRRAAPNHTGGLVWQSPGVK